VNFLVIGSGGREHALAWKLSHSPRFHRIFVAPGNPGIAQVATCLQPESSTPEGFLEVARQVDAAVTVVGPEVPLVAGVVDAFRAAGRKIIGPTQAAARLEGSKAFAKELVRRAKVPAARAETAAGAAEARRLVDAFGFPVVLKADGLAAGKGVVIAHDRQEALAALPRLPAGRILVEEFLTGEEVSFIVLADGERFWPLEATQDHKAVGDGDEGPNTGGMGAYCDGRIVTPAQIDEILERVIRPTLAQMAADGIPYTGFLYAGLMLTSSGPQVLEFNCRLGDPETQPLMHRLASDLVATLLDGELPRWNPKPSVCVVLAAHGYPGEVRTGDRISGLDEAAQMGAEVFHAGTRVDATGDLVTSGGRVLGVTAAGPDLRLAVANAYAASGRIHFEGMHFRRDIGMKGLKRW
jgi:phosphoribosylamine--glycine ligase